VIALRDVKRRLVRYSVEFLHSVSNRFEIIVIRKTALNPVIEDAPIVTAFNRFS
jgi:hypothetical protein